MTDKRKKKNKISPKSARTRSIIDLKSSKEQQIKTVPKQIYGPTREETRIITTTTIVDIPAL